MPLLEFLVFHLAANCRKKIIYPNPSILEQAKRNCQRSMAPKKKPAKNVFTSRKKNFVHITAKE
jgi:hypothetical protein